MDRISGGGSINPFQDDPGPSESIAITSWNTVGGDLARLSSYGAQLQQPTNPPGVQKGLEVDFQQCLTQLCGQTGSGGGLESVINYINYQEAMLPSGQQPPEVYQQIQSLNSSLQSMVGLINESDPDYLLLGKQAEQVNDNYISIGSRPFSS